MEHRYKHVARFTGTIHDGLLDWARMRMVDSGLDTVEVYAQFPPTGVQSSHLVMFLYQVALDPKMMENSPGGSLIGPKDRTHDRVSFVPKPWVEVGRAMAEGLAYLFPDSATPPRERNPNTRGRPFPTVESLPPALGEWYTAQSKGTPEDPETWVVDFGGEACARPPALWWRTGVTLTTRYIVVAGEPGRGTEGTRGSSAPVSLAALSVLATAMQMERVLHVKLPPPPFDEQITSYMEAMAAAVEQSPELASSVGRDRPEKYASTLAERIRAALPPVSASAVASIGLQPVHDLSNHEFAVLMQALQRPLQAALNMQLRLPLGSLPVFGPSSSVSIAMGKPARGGTPFMNERK